ncbi:MAG: hypothetical protein PWQ09_765 [Candidatus Cloacimonadota bacterium]|jgi:integrase|nr:hypothetical protein [Candidatus Cloacimonadota bacterium]
MNLERLRKRFSNKNFKVKIRFKKLKSGRYSIILDYRFMENGREYRERKSLGIYLVGTRKSYNEDKNKVDEAIIIRNKYEQLVNKNRHLINKEKTIYLHEWFDGFMNKQTKSNSRAIWRKTIRHLKIYQPQDMPLKRVTKEFCEGFHKYLKECKDLNDNTSHTYFARFKVAINMAYEEDIIPRNYAKKLSFSKTNGTREYLTFEEITKIYEMPYINETVKRAFIFSCFTGLRLSDLYGIKFKNIIKENGNYYLAFSDKKTNGFNKFILHPTAEKIYKKEKKSHGGEHIFDLPHEATFRYHLRKIIEKAGIDKHITPHCGRHTFATLCITSGMDLFTLSKYLGHKDVKVTQIYAKLIDKKKDEAIKKLPVL